MANQFVESGRMQFTPNFPPYALPIVMEKRGKAASAGEIPHAFTYSPYVDSIVAVDIDQDLVEFWQHMQDVMKHGGVHDFLSEFIKYTSEFEDDPEGKLKDVRVVSIGPLEYLPFLRSTRIFNEVKEHVDKLKIIRADITDFLEESRRHGEQYNTLLLNNVPDYMEDWNSLFENPPVSDNGLVVLVRGAKGPFGLRSHVYKKGDRLTPGIRVGENGRLEKNLYSQGWESIDVAEALQPHGYTPTECTFVMDRTPPEKKEKKSSIVFDTVMSPNGRARILAREFIPHELLRDYVALAFKYNSNAGAPK